MKLFEVIMFLGQFKGVCLFIVFMCIMCVFLCIIVFISYTIVITDM